MMGARSIYPRTLIISWHWPPTNRASAGVLGALFSHAPPGAFRVITRSFDEKHVNDTRPGADEIANRVPPTFVRWPGDDQGQPGFGQSIALLRATCGFMTAARRIHRAWDVERVLAVYPHRMSLLMGWWIARRLRVPLVLHMHDLCAEALTIGNPARRAFWRRIDGRALRDAWMVIVPTEEFANHYRGRGIKRCWVLPHCAPHGWAKSPTPCGARDGAPAGASTCPTNLHLLYAGQVYEPHVGAMAAFIDATRDLTNVEVTYLSKPEAMNGMMGRVGARWLPHDRALATMRLADVFVVVLGACTWRPQEEPLPHGRGSENAKPLPDGRGYEVEEPLPLPERRFATSWASRSRFGRVQGRGSEHDEVMGCFPSKIIDYLSIGRPILAIVPPGCFVDRLVTETGCGLVVRRHDVGSIRDAVEALRAPNVRIRMIEASRRVLQQLSGDEWMPRLLERLRYGPPNRSSMPRFPNPLVEAAESTAFQRLEMTPRRLAAAEMGQRGWPIALAVGDPNPSDPPPLAGQGMGHPSTTETAADREPCLVR